MPDAEARPGKVGAPPTNPGRSEAKPSNPKGDVMGEKTGDRPMTRAEIREMWGEVYKRERDRFEKERDEARSCARNLADALRDLLEAPIPTALDRSAGRRERNAARSALAAWEERDNG